MAGQFMMIEEGDTMLRSMIAYALGQAFPEKDIHKEQTSQIDRPAFYIGEIKTHQSGKIGNNYRRTYQMVVRYFPEEDNLSDYEALSIVADKLYACLEHLAYEGNKARAVQMHHRLEDNVLHFFFTIYLSLKRPENHIKMEVLEEYAYLKDGIGNRKTTNFQKDKEK